MDMRRRNSEFLDPDHTPSSFGARAGAVLGASAAALISAGLVYWISSGGDPTLKRLGHAPSAPTYAPPEADPAQVVRAYEQLQDVYADRGPDGVAGFARGCARSLAADPAALDFCIAFDIYAGSLVGDDAIARAWRAGSADRELALARAALPPTSDPVARVAQVRRLARETSLHALGPARLSTPRPALHRVKAARHAKPVSRAPAHAAEHAPEHAPEHVPESVQQAASPAVASAAAAAAAEPAVRAPDQPLAPAVQPVEPSVATTAQAKPRARPPAVKKASVRRPRGAAAKAEACRRKATPGERTVCASPALRQADVQLQAAYRKAVAAGADAGDLARAQARFRRAVNAAAPDRVAVERLYYQRTRKLEALSQAP